MLVVDQLAAAQLLQLAEAMPAEVKTIKPDLDMPAAYLDLARGNGKGGSGVSFRLNFVALTQAAANNDLVKVKQHAASALAIAQEHGWPHMQIAVHMALAATQLGARQPNEAIAAYRAAGAIAADATGKGDAVALKLLLQTKLGEGAALVSDARHADAAKIYEEAAALAQKSEDHLMAMESWRMAAYCHEQIKETESSFRCGIVALNTAERLDAETRTNSTLPYVGQGLLRLLQPKGRLFRRATREDEARAEHVRSRMARLAGPDWEKTLEPEKDKTTV
jgi:tetratricopeptide (TPR) repeat protein